MAKYINTDVLEVVGFTDQEGSFSDGVQWLLEYIDTLPSADVQPVVRCKDCVHYIPYDWMFSEVWQSQNIEDYPQNEIGCEWIDHHINPEGYCSLGERKEQKNDT